MHDCMFIECYLVPLCFIFLQFLFLIVGKKALLSKKNSQFYHGMG